MDEMPPIDLEEDHDMFERDYDLHRGLDEDDRHDPLTRRPPRPRMRGRKGDRREPPEFFDRDRKRGRDGKLTAQERRAMGRERDKARREHPRAERPEDLRKRKLPGGLFESSQL
jgi:hypothetical protein